MRIKLLKKLSSRKGASLTFALLAFLVCAVVGAVVVSAGMASAGRVAGLAETDQRYYAVTSAAQLFRDSLDGQTFEIERVMTETTTAVVNYQPIGSGSGSSETDEPAEDDTPSPEPGEPEPSEPEPGEPSTSDDSYARIEKIPVSNTTNYAYSLGITPPGAEDATEFTQTFTLVEGEDGSGLTALPPNSYVGGDIEDFVGNDILRSAVITFLLGSPAALSDNDDPSGGLLGAYAAELGDFAKEPESGETANAWKTGKNYEMSFTAPGLTNKDLDPLKVTITARMKKDGSLVISFQNCVDDPDEPVYALELTMSAKVEDNSDSPIVKKTETVTVTGDAAPYEERTVTTTVSTKTTRITWSVSDVKKKVDET